MHFYDGSIFLHLPQMVICSSKIDFCIYPCCVWSENCGYLKWQHCMYKKQSDDEPDHANKTLTGASWCANLLFFCISSDSLSSNNIKMHWKKKNRKKIFKLLIMAQLTMPLTPFCSFIWFDCLCWLLAPYQVTQSIIWLCNQPVDQESSNSIVASYQRAVAPRPPGCTDTVVRAGQKADLGSGWHFILITQTGLRGADLSVRSLLDTPWRSNTWNWVTSLWGSTKFLTWIFFFFFC